MLPDIADALRRALFRQERCYALMFRLCRMPRARHMLIRAEGDAAIR